MRVKLLIYILVVVLFTTIGASQVFYDVEAGSEHKKVNTTIQMDCDPGEEDCPVSQWNINWRVPENATITDVKSSRGEVEEYNKEGNRLTVTTSVDGPTENETILVSYNKTEEPDIVENGFYSRELSLSGFSGESVSGEIKVENLTSGVLSSDYMYHIENETLTFNTEGSANIVVNSLINDNQYLKTDKFVFKNSKTEKADKAYEYAVGNAGRTPSANKVPVVMLDSQEYDRKYSEWSQGQYSRDIIKMRDDLENSELPVLVHEVVHMINSDVLTWDNTGTSYLDEGIATHIEYITDQKINNENPSYEIFGEEVTYEERRDGQLYEVTLPPRGNKDNLWEYYQQEQDFMINWDGQDPETREFGYSYSQLIIMNYVSREEGEISELISQLSDVEEEAENPEEKWGILEEKIDLQPCNYEEREEFEQCLTEVNDYNYTLNRAEDISYEEQEIEVEEIEIIDYEENESEQTEQHQEESNLAEIDEIKILENALEFIEKIITKVQNLF